jgi:hypothetical protein
MSESKILLSRFAGKGGMFGTIAGKYMKSTKKSTKFLHEMKHHLKHNKQRMVEIWGKRLISELEKFTE